MSLSLDGTLGHGLRNGKQESPGHAFLSIVGSKPILDIFGGIGIEHPFEVF